LYYILHSVVLYTAYEKGFILPRNKRPSKTISVHALRQAPKRQVRTCCQRYYAPHTGHTYIYRAMPSASVATVVVSRRSLFYTMFVLTEIFCFCRLFCWCK